MGWLRNLFGLGKKVSNDIKEVKVSNNEVTKTRVVVEKKGRFVIAVTLCIVILYNVIAHLFGFEKVAMNYIFKALLLFLGG